MTADGRVVPLGDDARTPTWVRAIDGLLECGAYGFAAWTLFYELALLTQWSLWWPARIWILLVAGLVAWRAYAGRRQVPPRADHELAQAPRRATSSVRWPQVGLVLAAAAVLVTLIRMRATLGVLPVVWVSLLFLALGCVPIRGRTRRHPARVATERVRPVAHVVAALVCVGLALLASARVASSGDDVYYVNRAVWVAERGIPTLRDTIFSAGDLPTIYGNALPLASIEAWQGAMAHVLHMPAPSFIFFWTVPVLAAASGWASWRLVRTWAPRRAGLVFLVATMFMLFVGSVIGRYYIGAIWEGKIPAVIVVVPLAWHYLTRLINRPRRADVAMLLALGICFVGLTSTAALIAPVIAAGGLLAAWLHRSRACALGAGCFLLAPVLAGVASALGPGVGGSNPQPLPSAQVFGYLFGTGTAMIALGVVGTVLGVRLMRGPAATVATCAALSGLASLMPGVFDAVNAATGAGPVAWRMIFAIPVAVLVGMLVTARLPATGVFARQQALLDWGTGLAICAVLVALIAQGTPLWSSKSGATFAFGQWKMDQKALQDVRAVSQLQTPAGLWLLPPAQMAVLAMTTTQRSGVVPRAFFLTNLKTTDVALADRRTLYGLVTGHYQAPDTVRGALRRLRVSLACVPSSDPRARRILASAVGTPLQPHGTMRCHVS